MNPGKIRPPAARRTVVDLLERRGLRRSQTLRRIGPRGAARHIARRIEVAAARVVDEPVGEPVDLVAFRHDALGDERQLLDRNRRFGQRPLVPQRADREARLVDPRRVGDDAVEVLRVALGFDEALPAPVRTGIPVRTRDGPGIVPRRDRLGGLGRHVDGPVRVVDGLLRIAHDERGLRLLAGVVTGVGHRHGKAQAYGIDPLAGAQWIVEALPRVAAVADHVETAVPARRQVHLEGDFRSQHAADAAMFGHIRRRGHDARLNPDQVFAPEVREPGAGKARFELALRIVRQRALRAREGLRVHGPRREPDERRHPDHRHGHRHPALHTLSY